jgi:hypothetical protein
MFERLHDRADAQPCVGLSFFDLLGSGSVIASSVGEMARYIPSARGGYYFAIRDPSAWIGQAIGQSAAKA